MTKDSELKALIDKAIKKLGCKKENELCRYIPINTGGYIHHFTFRKLKTENPNWLAEQVRKYIVDAPKPTFVTPKSRAPRGSRKKRDQLHFTKHDIERLLHMARVAGDKDMVRKLTQKDLKQVRRELISSIKQGRVEADLWNAYVEAVSNQQAQAEAIASGHALAR